MRIPRIFHPYPLQPATQITLDDNAARHVARVLRLGIGAQLRLFDGHGGEYPATIHEAGKREVIVTVGEHQPLDIESPLNITLAQGISKGERMDFTLQKAVELGAKRIVPLNTEHSVVHLKGERRERKLEHWQGIIISACEQCGRNNLPELLPMHSFNAWLEIPQPGLRLLLDHRADTTVGSLEKATDITLLIGPEGGLSECERSKAYDAGYTGLRLGPRVLRTETAALTALAALQSGWGDLG
jgi:16S rRNA (uracil1498-N3)-methyltransferase